LKLPKKQQEYNKIKKGYSPGIILIYSFIAGITAGTILLSLPISYRGESLSFIDRLFTATSALCVTGLVVADTGTKFTYFGQIVILVLIQLGGLGLMTFSTIFTLLIRRKISVKEKLIIREGLNKYGISETHKVIRYIIVFTFVIEIIGAIILFHRWHSIIPSSKKRFYFALFHSISAFCNAGFSLFSDSLVRFWNDYVTVLTITLLIIIGGIGFFANYEIKNFIVNKLPFLKKVFKLKSFYLHTSLHTKIVIITTIILILIGIFLINIFEFSGVLKEKNIENRIIIAYFQSITARTAGFNTVNIGSLSSSSLIILIMLMFIGGSPGSTAGGIKTTTAATLFLTLRSLLKGRQGVEVYSRTIPQIIIMRAIVIFTLALLLILFSFAIILAVEKSKFSSMSILFEVVSAFGTVGLTTGITSALSPLSKIILVLLMFTGRIGPLTIAVSITEKDRQLVKYPEENISVG